MAQLPPFSPLEFIVSAVHPAEDMRELRKKTLGENGIMPILEKILPQIDYTFSGLLSDGVGLPPENPYNAFLGRFSKLTGELKKGSCLAYQFKDNFYDLSIVKDTDGKIYIGNGWENGKPKQIIARVTNLKKGEIKMAIDVDQEETEHFKKAASALALMQAVINITDFSVIINGRSENNIRKVDATTYQYLLKQDNHDHHGLIMSFERDLKT